MCQKHIKVVGVLLIFLPTVTVPWIKATQQKQHPLRPISRTSDSSIMIWQKSHASALSK